MMQTKRIVVDYKKRDGSVEKRPCLVIDIEYFDRMLLRGYRMGYEQGKLDHKPKKVKKSEKTLLRRMLDLIFPEDYAVSLRPAHFRKTVRSTQSIMKQLTKPL